MSIQRFLRENFLRKCRNPRFLSSGYATLSSSPSSSVPLEPPQLPEFDYQPKPYNGPLADDVLMKRKKFLGPSLFHYYQKPVSTIYRFKSLPFYNCFSPFCSDFNLLTPSLQSLTFFFSNWCGCCTVHPGLMILMGLIWVLFLFLIWSEHLLRIRFSKWVDYFWWICCFNL